MMLARWDNRQGFPHARLDHSTGMEVRFFMPVLNVCRSGSFSRQPAAKGVSLQHWIAGKRSSSGRRGSTFKEVVR
jgi:hypothetical protein